jgi:hypothetical protein
VSDARRTSASMLSSPRPLVFAMIRAVMASFETSKKRANIGGPFARMNCFACARGRRGGPPRE